MYGGDEIGALVLDTGTHTLKAGYAGEGLLPCPHSLISLPQSSDPLCSQAYFSPPSLRRHAQGRLLVRQPRGTSQ